LAGGGGKNGRRVVIDRIACIYRCDIVLAKMFEAVAGRMRGVDQEDGIARARGGATLVGASDDGIILSRGQERMTQVRLGFVGWRGVVVAVVCNDRVDSEQAAGASTVFVLGVVSSCHGCGVRSKW
jgi:hypothetical protein